MKKIKVPAQIAKEIELINKGKRRPTKKSKEDSQSREFYLEKAVENLNFINRVIEVDPIRSYLEENLIFLINDIAPHKAPGVTMISKGTLIMKKVGSKTGLYYWLDADYPVNRSDRNFELVTEKAFESWHIGNLIIFAELNEKKIWKIILNFLKRHRERI